MALTPRREKFAQSIAKGMTRSDAYRASYSAKNMKDATVVNNSYKLMQFNDILTRIEELRKPVFEAVRITLKSHLDDLQSLRNMAIKKEQYSAAISAEIARGKVSGLYKEAEEDEDAPPVESITITIKNANKRGSE